MKGRGARLRARDVDILLALAKMRLLRTSAICRLFFVAKGTCQKRLRRLFDAGLLRAVVTGLAEENRFALTKLGHALVCKAVSDAVIPEYRPPPRVDRRSVQHLDLMNEYRIAIALGLAAAGLELRGFVPDWELRAQDPHAGLVPDALVTFAKVSSASDPSRRTAPPTVLGLEVDTGAETPGIVVKKVLRYRERRALGQKVFGAVPDAVLFLVRTERRARSLARQIASAGGEGAPPIVLLGLEKDLLEDGGVSKGLRRPKDILEGQAGDARHAAPIGLQLLIS